MPVEDQVQRGILNRIDRSIGRSVDRAHRQPSRNFALSCSLGSRRSLWATCRQPCRILALLCSLGWRRSLLATLVPVEDQVQSGVLNRIDRSIGRSVDRVRRPGAPRSPPPSRVRGGRHIWALVPKRHLNNDYDVSRTREHWQFKPLWAHLRQSECWNVMRETFCSNRGDPKLNIWAL